MHRYQCHIFIFGMGSLIFSPMHCIHHGTLVSRSWQLDVHGRMLSHIHSILRDIEVRMRHDNVLLFLFSMLSILDGLPGCVRSLTAPLLHMSTVLCSFAIALS